MRVLIVSDTHRRQDNYRKVLDKIGKPDMVVHCGDAEGAEYTIGEMAGCPLEIVLGNNDFFSDLPREKEFMIGRYKVWLTHGHNYYVSMETEVIKSEAVARGADIVMFGHTHRPLIDIGSEVTALNPGSLTYPRQEGKRPSYMLMDIDREGEAHFTICYL